MENRYLAAVCGLYCGICEYEEGQCSGCTAIEGRPSWVAEVGRDVCNLYDCCVNDRDLEHCGMCPDLPCEMFSSSHDPSLTGEQAREDIANRRKTLIRRRHIGTERWLEEQEAAAAQDGG